MKFNGVTMGMKAYSFSFPWKPIQSMMCATHTYYLIYFLTSLYIQFGNKGGSDIE
jgi:hypothetical protein